MVIFVYLLFKNQNDDTMLPITHASGVSSLASAPISLLRHRKLYYEHCYSTSRTETVVTTRTLSVNTIGEWSGSLVQTTIKRRDHVT